MLHLAGVKPRVHRGQRGRVPRNRDAGKENGSVGRGGQEPATHHDGWGWWWLL